MRIAVTGGSGLVGYFLVQAMVRAGHDVTVLSRSAPPPGRLPASVAWRPYDLGGPVPGLDGMQALVHAAFDHLPGRYRGGEGADPEGFRRRNELGSQRIVDAAGDAGCRVIFLSSRAVYGVHPEGTVLSEARDPRPDTLYGRVKLAVEGRVTARGGVSLRATGVYGPPGLGQRQKWADLFEDFAAGRPIAPRKASEVHGADLAAACLIALTRDTPPVLNVSDLMLDRHNLLALWSDITGTAGTLPAPVAGPGPARMDCTALRALGWRPQGKAGLRAALAAIAAQLGAVRTP